jgi:sarcosine oxidase, subunit beta
LAFAAAARRAGVTIRQGAPVRQLCVSGSRISGVVLDDGSSVSAGSVVVAAGVWSRELLGPLGIDLPVRAQRETILLLETGAATPVRELPVFSDLADLQYVRPERSGQLLVGNSDHSRPEWADPDAYSNRPTEEFLEAALTKVDHRFPGFADLRFASAYAGCYDVTPDYNPVMSTTPVAGLHVAAGFSGHGFKISPAVGELMADLVVHGASRDPRVPESDFALDRFAAGRPLTSAHPYAGAGEMR